MLENGGEQSAKIDHRCLKFVYDSIKEAKTMLTDRVEISSQTRKEVLLNYRTSGGKLFAGLPYARVEQISIYKS